MGMYIYTQSDTRFIPTHIQKMWLLIFYGSYRATSSTKLPKKISSVNHQKGGKIDKTEYNLYT
jgi:hypothetical protein